MGVVALVQGRAGSLYSPPDYSKGYGCGCNRNIDRLAKYRKHKGRKEGGGRDVGRAGGRGASSMSSSSPPKRTRSRPDGSETRGAGSLPPRQFLISTAVLDISIF